MGRKINPMNDFVNLVYLLGCTDRCQHLESDGKRCKRYAQYRRSYSGSEMYDNDQTRWVCVELCPKHAKETFNVPKDHAQLDIIVYKQVA